MSSLFLSGTELSVIMSLSKDYISLRWFLHWENYASLNWNVFRELLCMCFLTHNTEGDLFASLIGQHLLGLEEKHFLSLQCHNLHFFGAPSATARSVQVWLTQVQAPGTQVGHFWGGICRVLMHICKKKKKKLYVPMVLLKSETVTPVFCLYFSLFIRRWCLYYH